MILTANHTKLETGRVRLITRMTTLPTSATISWAKDPEKPNGVQVSKTVPVEPLGGDRYALTELIEAEVFSVKFDTEDTIKRYEISWKEGHGGDRRLEWTNDGLNLIFYLPYCDSNKIGVEMFDLEGRPMEVIGRQTVVPWRRYSEVIQARYGDRPKLLSRVGLWVPDASTIFTRVGRDSWRTLDNFEEVRIKITNVQKATIGNSLTERALIDDKDYGISYSGIVSMKKVV